MASKVSDLTELAAGDLAQGTDYIYVVDTSAGISGSKKMTPTAFLTDRTFTGTLTWAGSTGANIVAIPDNLADAWSLKQSSNAYITAVTTDSAEAVLISQDLQVANTFGLVVGATAQQTVSTGDGSTSLIPEVQVLGTTKTDASLLLASFSATSTTAACPSLNMLKSAHATLGSNTVVVSGEVLGEVNFFGADGTDFKSPAVRLQAVVDTTPGTGDMPGRLVISTTADGGETLTEALRITSSQDVRINDAAGLIVGSTSAQLTVSNGDGSTDLIPEVQVLGTTKTDSSLLLASFSATSTTAACPSLNFLKSAHATIGSNTVVVSGEVIGEVNFFAADGTDFESPAARIQAAVDATPGTGDMPGRLVFSTTPDGSETLTEAMRITSAQDVRVNDASGLIVGSTSAQITISDGDGTTDLIPEVQVLGTTKTDASVLIAGFNTTDTTVVAPSLNFLKSGHGTIGSNTVVANNEILGEINFFGADGTDFESAAARIHVAVNATPGTGDMPGRIVFSTSSDGGETLVERARIAEAGVSLGVAGTTLGKLLFNGNTSGTITVNSAAAAGTWTFTLPPDDGDAGEQLQTDGNGVTTWEAAGSLREVKQLLEELSGGAEKALSRLCQAGVYAFRYIAGARPTTGDRETVYTGVVADELPEVMHHGGRIFSPVSAFGQAVLAIKALAARNEQLEARLLALESARG